MQNTMKDCHWYSAQKVTPDLIPQNHMWSSRFFPQNFELKKNDPNKWFRSRTTLIRYKLSVSKLEFSNKEYQL